MNPTAKELPATTPISHGESQSCYNIDFGLHTKVEAFQGAIAVIFFLGILAAFIVF